jgi:hypothetical protein
MIQTFSPHYLQELFAECLVFSINVNMYVLEIEVVSHEDWVFA